MAGTSKKGPSGGSKKPQKKKAKRGTAVKGGSAAKGTAAKGTQASSPSSPSPLLPTTAPTQPIKTPSTPPPPTPAQLKKQYLGIRVKHVSKPPKGSSKATMDQYYQDLADARDKAVQDIQQVVTTAVQGGANGVYSMGDALGVLDYIASYSLPKLNWEDQRMALSNGLRGSGLDHWSLHLVGAAKGGGMAGTLDNGTNVLSHDLRWAKKLRFNILSRKAEWCDSMPALVSQMTPVGDLQDEHYPYVMARLRREWTMACARDVIHAAIYAAAKCNAVNPLKDWLEGLAWDGVERLKELPRILGADDTPETRRILRRFMIGAVARGVKPGCKMDYMLVLEGKQGALKSTFARVLAGDDRFGELGDVKGREAAMQLAGKWIIEMAEVDFFRGKRSSELKEFVSRQEDEYRPPYGKNAERFHRMCVFIATTNQDQYLQDATGGRRFWPIKCGDEIDIAWVKKHRDQLWAEAVAAFNAGEKWWPEDKAEAEYLAALQEDRFELDPWEERVADIVSGKTTYTLTGKILSSLDREVPQWTRLDEMRIAKIMKRLGWSQKRKSVGGKDKERYWLAPGKTWSQVMVDILADQKLIGTIDDSEMPEDGDDNPDLQNSHIGSGTEAIKQ